MTFLSFVFFLDHFSWYHAGFWSQLPPGHPSLYCYIILLGYNWSGGHVDRLRVWKKIQWSSFGADFVVSVCWCCDFVRFVVFVGELSCLKSRLVLVNSVYL